MARRFSIFVICVLLPSSLLAQEIISWDHVWKYQDSGTNLDNTGWNQPAYDDDWWPLGPGMFGFPTNEFLPPGRAIQTRLTLQDNSGVRTPTFYFRAKFRWVHPDFVQNIFLTFSNLI